MMAAWTRGAVTGRLGFRLMLAVAVALTPLAFLSYSQAKRSEIEAQARIESALFGETLMAATPQISEINRTRGLAAATANAILSVLDDPTACSAEMRQLVQADGEISFAAFIRPTGEMPCSSSAATSTFAGPRLDALNADPRPMMMVSPRGEFTGESVLVFTHPVRDAQGGLRGYVSISVPHRALRQATVLDKSKPHTDLLALITFDAKGTVLTSLFGLDTVYLRLPVGRALTTFVNAPPQTFLGQTLGGETRSFAVTAIVPGVLYVLGSWPDATRAGATYLERLPLWAMPLAIWFASLAAAWIGAEVHVLRPVRSLRRSIISFAGGSRTVALPELADAATELRDVGDAYERMMSAVMHNEAELEDTVHQREVLLREVHHRVKNNLQLIASIMNLQMRKSVTPEARQLLRGLQDRVMSLATVHRELYQTSGLADVDAAELLESIVAQVIKMGTSPDRPVKAHTDLAPIRLSPDQAVPLSLIVTEALTNALRHAVRAGYSAPQLSVTLQQLGADRAMLLVTSDLDPADPAQGASDLLGSGLGHQLLAAFANQLSGHLTVGEDQGRFVVRLDFPVLSRKVPPPDQSASLPA